MKILITLIIVFLSLSVNAIVNMDKGEWPTDDGWAIVKGTKRFVHCENYKKKRGCWVSPPKEAQEQILTRICHGRPTPRAWNWDARLFNYQKYNNRVQAIKENFKRLFKKDPPNVYCKPGRYPEELTEWEVKRVKQLEAEQAKKKKETIGW